MSFQETEGENRSDAEDELERHSALAHLASVLVAKIIKSGEGPASSGEVCILPYSAFPRYFCVAVLDSSLYVDTLPRCPHKHWNELPFRSDGGILMLVASTASNRCYTHATSLKGCQERLRSGTPPHVVNRAKREIWTDSLPRSASRFSL